MRLDGTTLEPLVHIAGVRAALLVAAEDGLVIADAAMTNVDPQAIAALTSSLWSKVRKASVASGHRPPGLVEFQATRGAVVVAELERDILGVAVTVDKGSSGLVRLALLELRSRDTA